jgi:hypothetical protein
MGMSKGIFEGWCVLRTKARHTLRLAQSLGEDGFEVWTPVETRTVRIPRVNVRRDVRLPIMPSYVFARARHLIDLIMLAGMPVKPRRGAGLRKPAHEDFRVMRCPTGIPAVSDEDLRELRKIEAKRTPIQKAAKVIPSGSPVRVEGGSFGGMSGVVERGDRTHTLVCFNDRYLVKIPTCILTENMAGAGEPVIGMAA